MATSAREVARRALRRVEGDDAYATLALAGEIERAGLDGPERGLATEIVYGVLRHRSRIDRALAAMAPRKLKVSSAVRVLLRVAAYQILFLDRVPESAAVDEAVAAARKLGGQRMGGFANGLLRRLCRDGEPPLPKDGHPRDIVAAHNSLPLWIVNELERAVGADDLADAAAGFNEVPGLTLRANRRRTSVTALIERLEAERPRVRIARTDLDCALFVSGLGAPEHSPSFQEGLWSVQDLGAQKVGALAEPEPGQRILDACAGVGGKSTHIAELTDDAASITAADLSQRKLDLCGDSCRRLGLQSVKRVVCDLLEPGEAIAPEYDAVVLDAPCSGLGVLRRHPEAKWRLEQGVVAEMAALQARLLDSLAPRVAAGGTLVYSVCSFTEREGPGQIEAFLARNSAFQREVEFRTWPHRDRADAFYAARLRRSPAG